MSQKDLELRFYDRDNLVCRGLLRLPCDERRRVGYTAGDRSLAIELDPEYQADEEFELVLTGFVDGHCFQIGIESLESGPIFKENEFEIVLRVIEIAPLEQA